MNDLFLTVKIARKTPEAIDICSFELVDPQGKSLPSFSAGSHIDVHGPTGLVRQYSLCNDPSETGRYLIGVLRDPKSRGGSNAMHDLLNEGDEVRISPPKNHFALAHGSAHSLLLAGGIGITPILCMAERLCAVGAAFELHYLSRSRQRAAFIDRISRSAFSARTELHFDDEVQTKVDISDLLGRADRDTHLYVCGPSGFMQHVLDTARALGWSEERLHYEFFGAVPVAQSGWDKQFAVKIASSGKCYEIAPDKSVVAALREHGIEIPVSCEQGVCGTCITRVLDGEPDHRDHYFTAAEHEKNDQFTPCCSRSKSQLLVLDL